MVEVFFEGATRGGTWTRDLQYLCPALLKIRSHVYYSLSWSVVGYSPKNLKKGDSLLASGSW